MKEKKTKKVEGVIYCPYMPITDKDGKITMKKIPNYNPKYVEENGKIYTIFSD